MDYDTNNKSYIKSVYQIMEYSVVFSCCTIIIITDFISLVQRSPTKCGVSECDLETSKRRRPRPALAVAPHEWNGFHLNYLFCFILVVCVYACVRACVT
jgi:hypothetical protein